MEEKHLPTELLVANTILAKGFKEGYSLSPLKLQKLLYFVYKKYLQDYNEALFDGYFEVWKTGPVLRIVHNEFKAYGSVGIKDYAYQPFDDETVYIVDVNLACFYKTLERVWSKYKNYSGSELSHLTKEKDTAWYITLNELNNLYIGDNEIEKEYWFR